MARPPLRKVVPMAAAGFGALAAGALAVRRFVLGRGDSTDEESGSTPEPPAPTEEGTPETPEG
jgi:hypothetical protein